MDGKQEKPEHTDSDGRDVPDEDLRMLFQRTAPRSHPLDIDELLVRAGLRTRAHRGKWLYRSAAGIAAAILMLVGVGGGWWAGRQAAADEAARLEAVLVSAQSQITRDMAEVLQAIQASNAEAQRDSLKRVAVLLRDDYRTRIAELEHRVSALAMVMDSREAVGE